jgi:flagellar protein FliS
MAYDGAIRFSQEAKKKLESKDLEGKGFYIGKAHSTISELRASLNLEKGGEVAHSLNKLYSFMSRQLTLANFKNDPRPLDLVIKLLTELRDAWREVVRLKPELRK